MKDFYVQMIIVAVACGVTGVWMVHGWAYYGFPKYRRWTNNIYRSLWAPRVVKSKDLDKFKPSKNGNQEKRA